MMGIFTKNKFIFNKDQEKTIVENIKLAEDETSGEIRIHVEPTCKEDSFQRALELFKELGMHRTKLQNGVLFYIAFESHKFSIVADEGINKVVPLDFWENLKEKLSLEFKKGRFVEGLSEALALTGQQLKLHFPHNGKDDKNELSDKISK
jgi:uncharacterized membrane protein